MIKKRKRVLSDFAETSIKDIGIDVMKVRRMLNNAMNIFSEFEESVGEANMNAKMIDYVSNGFENLDGKSLSRYQNEMLKARNDAIRKSMELQVALRQLFNEVSKGDLINDFTKFIDEMKV